MAEPPRKSLSKADLPTCLRRAWFHLRLSVRDPTRIGTWDAILVTAASPEQAQLYNRQLIRAKKMGRIAKSTVTLAVPDPRGMRIGSGAATLNAVHALADHLRCKSPKVGSTSLNNGSSFYECSSEENYLSSLVELLREKHILLVHAGGDSKRVPWANPMGKVFLPLPYMAIDDPDGPVPFLFDHILAIASCARQAFQNKGGMFIMTGDVLPCFDAFSMVLRDDMASIVTVPIALDVAANHGVIVASNSEQLSHNSSVALVENLLQKPTIDELQDHQAILDDGRTLLDTGIIAVKGKAWVDLVVLAISSRSMILELMESKMEMSLYEDLVAAWVPVKHDWLKLRPFGEELVRVLGKQKIFSYCANDLLFLHFGTSSEFLHHLNGTGSAILGRRHLCSIPATTASDISSSSIIISSTIAPGVSVGEESLIYDSSIHTGVRVGSQSIVVGLRMPDVILSVGHSFRFMLPDRHCLWEIPLLGHAERAIVYCSIHDNPKVPMSKGGTFCGKPWIKVLEDLDINDSDIWGPREGKDKCLWNAKIFPVVSYSQMLQLATWLMGLNGHKNELLYSWKNSTRISFEELHKSIDFSEMWLGSVKHQTNIAAQIVTACLNFGLLNRNVFQLCQEILEREDDGIEICNKFFSFFPNIETQNPQILPKSRAHQVHLDLLRGCNNEKMAAEMEQKVWDAVMEETASAVRYSSSSRSFTSDYSFSLRNVKVELPVRVDFVGGWSDTPPWSLERYGCVLNMAITLEGSLPVGAAIEAKQGKGVLMTDDAGNILEMQNISSISPPFHCDDPFRLVKSALFVTDVMNEPISQMNCLHIKTWANVPRGSGLGTSSILLAAVVKALLLITKRDHSNENVTRLVLVSEQVMGTGGGWQDQVGGLYPGIKFTSSFPGIPLQLQVIPLMASAQLIEELKQRLLVVFTGQVRLAHEVLQNVVIRYLRRDNLLVSSIRRLIELAKTGREALMNCDINELGNVMLEAWRLHQELDPFCSNIFVDKLFAFCDPYCCGYKLVGAGGGGFSLMLAKTAESATKLRHLIADHPEFDAKFYDWDIFFA